MWRHVGTTIEFSCAAQIITLSTSGGLAGDAGDAKLSILPKLSGNQRNQRFVGICLYNLEFIGICWDI